MKRKGTLRQQFVQRIPADLKALVVGRKLLVPVGEEFVPITISPKMDAIRLSLRTSVPSEVKNRQAQVAGYVEGVWEAMRTKGPVSLGQRDATALAGEFYHAWADGRGERRTSVQQLPDGSWHVDDEVPDNVPEEWQAVIDHMADLGEAERASELERSFGSIIDRMLLQRGIAEVTATSRQLILEAFRKALIDAAENRQRNASGDYSPDAKATRFPQWESPVASSRRSQSVPKISIIGLAEDWWKEAKAAGRSISTYESYRSAAHRLADFLKHDDAATVKPSDIVAFKDHRLANGISSKTVGDSDLSALRRLFGWAVDNLKLVTNPAAHVKVQRAKQVRIRSKGFTEQEAQAILRHSRDHQRGQESAHVAAAKRWVPWLCAYTGARLGEMVQLRKQDVRREGDCWIVTITPEAGTVKDKEAREVVLHGHLVDLGFPDFVKAAKHGHLFLRPNETGEIRGAWRSVKNRLSEFAREVVDDPAVAPNHGWRHLFKTIGRENGIADSVLDGICGHAPSSVGGSYGGVSLKAQRDAFAKFPRFVVK
ncbi:site-specific integrase [Mesorhizobium sp. IMUNJ 23232]|uniref:site-specific integrase n=1 Tax=Mesorhizobium sp. IMUNJ 23232 TaxID=3376064 RepID=UPI0037885DA2